MIIAELVIPQMFTAYAEDLKYLESNGLHHYQYFCEECDQIFASAWGRVSNSMSWCERGRDVSCTYCGKVHQKHIAYIKRREDAPNKVRLSVREYQKVVTFEAFSETVFFPDYLSLHAGRIHETFRVDIQKQTATFCIDGVEKPIELGNPFSLDLFNDRSILRFFNANSIANWEQKSELNRILKVFRETVHRKLERKLGHKIHSMYVSPGTYRGMFLLPLFNIAYRVACPDGPNLPVAYRENLKHIYNFLEERMIYEDEYDLMDQVISLTRSKQDFVSAMIQVYSLPDKPLVRKCISESPFSVMVFRKAFSLCKNYDNALRLYPGLMQLMHLPHTVKMELFKFLHIMKSFYGEAGIIRFVNEQKDLQLMDCTRIYFQLEPENKKALKTEKPRLRDLHDWMSLRHKMQTHENLKFDVPDHIVRRLSMQKDRLSFFLPKESLELLAAGISLHNCVASYGHAMKDNEKWIVLVADDKGKLAACLEICGKELRQAKIDRNHPAWENPELNAEIIAWAKKAKIKINTNDIQLQRKENLEIQETA